MYFSIIVPTRNRAEYLSICLKQITLQSFEDYEVLIIDDGSSLEVVNQYHEIIPDNHHFKLIKQNPPTLNGSGASLTRNLGLEHASGKFIAFCDDDDFWCDPEHLQIAFDSLNQSESDMYIANQKAVSNDGTVSFDNWFPHLSKNIDKYKPLSLKNNTYQLTLSQLLGESEIPQLNTLILRKNICDKINGFWPMLTYVEDRDFYLRALEYCNIICYRNDIVSQHNIPEINKRNSLSNCVSEKNQHIMMITVLNHVLANTDRIEIIRFCRQFLGWKYRNLSMLTINQSQIIFAENALVSLFTIKWFIFMVYLKLKSLFKTITKKHN